MYIPTFIDGQNLSARQVNTLTGAVSELYNRSLALRVPQAVEDCGTSELDVYERKRVLYIVHYHVAALAANEYLYYHIKNQNGGTVNIYYKDVLPPLGLDRPALPTPLVTFSTSGVVRGVVSLVDFPAALTHPIDEELVPITVTSTQDGTLIYELSEIISAPYGYVALNDAAALTKNESASVATDLQHLADNVTALELVSVAPNQGMIMGGTSTLSRDYADAREGKSAFATVFSGYLIRNDAGTLYYHIALGKDNSNNTHEFVRTYIYVNDTIIPSSWCEYEGLYNTASDSDMAHFDGYVDISSVSASPGELMKVEVICETTVISEPLDERRPVTGSAWVRVYYLGEGL